MKKIELLDWDAGLAAIKKVHPDLSVKLSKIDIDTSKPHFLSFGLGFGERWYENGSLSKKIAADIAAITNIDHFWPGTGNSTENLGPQVSLITNGSFEVSINHDGEEIPKLVAEPGNLLGLFESLTHLNPHPWTITAGSRNCFLVPDMLSSLKTHYSREKFNKSPLVGGNKPGNRGNVIVDLVARAGIDWQATGLIFSQTLVEYIKGAVDSHNYQLNLLIKDHLINQLVGVASNSSSTVGHHIADAHSRRKLSYLFNMARGYVPGFKPAISAIDLLPVYAVEEYLSQTHILPINDDPCPHPTIMVPGHYKKSQGPIYYAMSRPLDMQPVKNTQVALDKRLIDLYNNSMTEGKDGKDKGFNGDEKRVFDNLSFFYYAGKKEKKYDQLLPMIDLPKFDRRFKTERKFACHSVSVKGVIAFNGD